MPRPTTLSIIALIWAGVVNAGEVDHHEETDSIEDDASYIVVPFQEPVAFQSKVLASLQKLTESASSNVWRCGLVVGRKDPVTEFYSRPHITFSVKGSYQTWIPLEGAVWEHTRIKLEN